MPPQPKRNRALWLAVAVALLGASAWLMSRGDRERSTVRPPKMEFPRAPKAAEQSRNDRRRTLPPIPAPSDDAEGLRRKRDPLLVALPSDPKRSALVFEVDALKESPIGRVWLDCMLARNDRDRRGIERLKETYGVDLSNDVERVAVSSERVAILQGSFEPSRFERDGWKGRTYGEKGTIHENDELGRAVATWGGELLLLGNDVDTLEDAIDRLESDDPHQTSILSDTSSYGDVYGVLSPEDLAKALPEEQAELADKITSVVDRVEVHVDASDDVAMVADVRGPAGDDVADLAKSMGTALAVGRLKAQSDGDDKLAELLDYARVKPGQGTFSMDVALPVELLKDLGPCRKSRREAR